ncbi:hypothetical protein GF406_06130 [candidate division KSB1 bacterium]|nr:hypothetical protein [candidate division KSB1 bacterium]
MSQDNAPWQRYPQAESLIINWLNVAQEENEAIRNMAGRMADETSTRLFDWVDHLQIKDKSADKELRKAGFEIEEIESPGTVYTHPAAMLPRIVINSEDSVSLGVAIKAENLQEFMLMNGLTGPVMGTPFSGYRSTVIHTEGPVAFYAVERRGTRTLVPLSGGAGETSAYIEAVESWSARPRDLGDEDEAMEHAVEIAEHMCELVGCNLAAHIVLQVERQYWQNRNTAGSIQKMRQDRLGLGWANQDHHTFRSSRHYFPRLVQLFETLGFHCREQFYAGEEAGWGAQVMENPVSGHVLFLDLDLAPDELEIDFAHQPLQERDFLGTVGLWCGLHGDSILQAGMHHLEAQFDFQKLVADLQAYGIETMNPFSDFSYLKQAFTRGERWSVSDSKVHRLQERGLIDDEQAAKFLREGAVGSHLENLQRAEGFKGFNQSNVSKIIRETDPRRA